MDFRVLLLACPLPPTSTMFPCQINSVQGHYWMEKRGFEPAVNVCVCTAERGMEPCRERAALMRLFLQGSAGLCVYACTYSVHIKVWMHTLCQWLLLHVHFQRSWRGRPGPQGAEGQTLIIRRCGATGLSPLVGGRLGRSVEELLWLGATGRDRPGGFKSNGASWVGVRLRGGYSCFFND